LVGSKSVFSMLLAQLLTQKEKGWSSFQGNQENHFRIGTNSD